ncbi:MAG: hypothetical protein ACYTBP_06930 [Planctomycetota bacterium]|jgi:hypothetical protein
MAKHKSGLHKEISSIFDGVPLPSGKGSQQSSSSDSGRTGYVPPRSSIPTPPPQQAETPPPVQKPQVDTTPVLQKPTQPVKEQDVVKEFTKEYKPAKESSLKQTWEQIKSRFFESGDSEAPARQKVMVVLIPVLAIAMIFMMMRAFSTPESNAAATVVPTAKETVDNGIPKKDWQIPDLYPSAIRDPMQLAKVSIEKIVTGEVVVTGILYSEDKSSAVINGSIVSEGDEVFGITVIKIDSRNVTFQKGDKTWTQKVQE